VTVIQTSWLLFIPLRVREDYFAEEIVVLDNQDLLTMNGAELVKLEDKDYLRATFHADFNRVPDELGVTPAPAPTALPPQRTEASPGVP